MFDAVDTVIGALCAYDPVTIDHVESNWTFEKIARVWALKQLSDRTITEPKDRK